MSSRSSPPPGPRDVARIQAAAVVAQQTELAEREARLLERQQAVEQQEQQLASHLDEKRRQLLDLQEQLNAGRDRLRRDRHDLAKVQQETAAQQQDATALHQRLTGLRARFLKRWKKHWAQQRQRTARELRQVVETRERLQLERATFEQFRARCNADAELEKRRLQDERQTLHNERALFQQKKRESDDEQMAREYDLSHRTAAHLAEMVPPRRRGIAWTWNVPAAHRSHGAGNADRPRCGKLLLALERQRSVVEPPPLPPLPNIDFSRKFAELPAEVEAAFAARDDFQRQRQQVLERHAAALADQRLHLAELYERLARAEQEWRGRQVESAAELEVLAAELHRRDEELTGVILSFDACAERLRQEREATMRCAGNWNATRRKSLSFNNNGKESGVVCWPRLRNARRQPSAGSKRGPPCSTAGANAAPWRFVSFRRCCKRTWRLGKVGRSSATRGAVHRLVAGRAASDGRAGTRTGTGPPGIAPAGRCPAAAAKRLERLRRRWEGLSAVAQRHLEKRCAQLAAEQADLDERFAALQRQTEEAARTTAELAGERGEAERSGDALNEQNRQLEQLRAAAEQQRQLYERQLSEMREEMDRLVRLLIDDGPREELASCARQEAA